MPGYDMIVRPAVPPGANPAVVRVAALTEGRARRIAAQRGGGVVVGVVGLAYCPMCNGFAGLDDKPRHHQIPRCPGKWELPETDAV